MLNLGDEHASFVCDKERRQISMSCQDVHIDFWCVYCRGIGNWVGKCLSRKCVDCSDNILVTSAGQWFRHQIDLHEIFLSQVPFWDVEHFRSDSCVIYAFLFSASFTLTQFLTYVAIEGLINTFVHFLATFLKIPGICELFHVVIVVTLWVTFRAKGFAND